MESLRSPRNSEILRSGRLRHFERFRRVTPVESFECPVLRSAVKNTRVLTKITLDAMMTETVERGARSLRPFAITQRGGA